MLEFLFISFVVVVSIQLGYYSILCTSVAFSKKEEISSSCKNPISVIICAKNEEENLIKNLPFFENQNYPDYELILINDCSTDCSLEVMQDFKKRTSVKTTVVNVLPNEQFWGSKKYALSLGIKRANNEYLLFSDADCFPESKNWIVSMASKFSTDKKIVLGYGAFNKRKKSFLNKLIRYETILTAIQYFSFASKGMAYMGVGRNLAYTKSQFFKAGGFSNHMHIKSGDDDLFINQVATKINTAICINKESFTESQAKKSFRSWISQKSRHISTATHYKKSHQLLLGLFYMTQLLFWTLSILLLALSVHWEIVLTLVGLRFLFHYIIVGLSAKKLLEKDLIIFIPLYDIFLVFIQLFIFIKNLRSKPTHW